jgi:hypothetical protein
MLQSVWTTKENVVPMSVRCCTYGTARKQEQEELEHRDSRYAISVQRVGQKTFASSS